MSIKYNIFLAIFGMFLTSTQVLADCIVTNNNFNKSSKIIFVNQYNGSDQLAKIYSLDNVRNPYEANNVAAFQSIEKAKSLADTDNGDLILIKAGPQWTNYQAWEGNKLSEFNKEVMKAKVMSQRQCQEESLTWVPPAVNDNQPDQQPVTTDFVSDPDEVTLARTQETSPISLPGITSSNTNDTTQSSNSSGRTSSSSSSSGGSSRGANSNNSTNQTSQSSSQMESSELPTNMTSKANARNTTFGAPENLIDDPDTQSVSDSNEDVINESPEDEPLTENNPIQEIPDQSHSSACYKTAEWQYQIHQYQHDNDGWSKITPDSSSRLIYVSSSEGNDDKARYYSPSEVGDIDTPVNIIPFQSIAKAYKHVRKGRPDWILLKRGDSFELQSTLYLQSGESKNAPMVLTAYGNDKTRPVVDSKNFTALMMGSKSHIAIVGIELYPSKLDPNSTGFSGWGNMKQNAIGIASISGSQSDNILIENVRVSYYKNNIVIGGGGGHKNVVIRRNEILNAYSDTGHSQGASIAYVDGLLIEENLFDHNGWYQQRPLSVALNTKSYGYATWFNHNAYIIDSANMILRENLISRSSSIGVKFTANSDKQTKTNSIRAYNYLITDNIVTEGEVGFSLGGNTDFNNGYRWKNINVTHNIFSNIGRTKPTNRELSWNMQIDDWDTGSVCFNLMADQTNNSLTNIKGIDVYGENRDVSIFMNKFINIGLSAESYQNKSEDFTSYQNSYLPKYNTNLLNSYTGSDSYDTYIEGVRSRLEDNYLEYPDITNMLEYLRTRAPSF
ncbi:hypothetical protein GCM10025856_23520 [Methylophaga marina]|uniref:Right handed beta helix domain-containing protein n=1 Tax=Methylophaga marina TaxID=45495 RepID=A0ABN0TM01_9GAMM|nr:hypothetical protein [Methylophaga marina]BDZ74633.1 hypothetical protein GCM10025856_23520 [Methylophaga marina]